MTNKEREMFEMLREDPAIPQGELARRLGITRSSVSVHISNLTKKGFITGRGYILSQPGHVTVIGACNYDIVGLSSGRLIPEDSNPGTVQASAGGVGRNIAENLARLGLPVKMISALGDDSFGEQLVQTSTAAGVDMGHCHIQPGGRTSTYIAILDNDGEMHVALSDMRLQDEMPLEHLAKKRKLIEGSEILVLDANLSGDIFGYLMANFGGCRMFLDPVSVAKAAHAKPYIALFDTVKANRLEAEFFSGISITDDDTLKRAGEWFIKSGVRRVFISLGSRGLYYRTADEEGLCPVVPVQPVNATGAGDALMAGIVYGSLQGYSLDETARFGTALSRIALLSAATVSPLVSVDNVNAEMAKATAP